jgi:ribonuclease P protein component
LLVCKTASNGLDAARFCFVVSKRVSNKAVIRNKLKRRLRECVAGLLESIRPGFDCVIITYPGAETKDYQDLAAGVKKLLAIVGVLKA